MLAKYPCKERRGFTFAEMAIVILIMGILTAVAAPQYLGATNRYRVDAAALRIVADLNHVRGRAMMKGPVQEEWVSFYPATEKYEMHDDPDPDRSSTEYWVDLSQTAYPVDLVSVAFTNTEGSTSNETVKFDMYGFARSGTTPVAPLATGQIVVASGDEQRTIVIDPVTGKASTP